MVYRISVSGRKGGVGKTTVACGLASVFASQGKRVLMSAFSKNEHADSEDDIIDMLNQENVDSSSVQLESLASRQLNDKLESAMQILPMQQRQVFMLREWQGFSIKETAEILGCEIGTVKQHHYRALKALRQELAEFWDYANS